jgi:hypothetical protein
MEESGLAFVTSMGPSFIYAYARSIMLYLFSSTNYIALFSKRSTQSSYNRYSLLFPSWLRIDQLTFPSYAVCAHQSPQMYIVLYRWRDSLLKLQNAM